MKNLFSQWTLSFVFLSTLITLSTVVGSANAHADNAQCREDARRAYEAALDDCENGGGSGGQQCVTGRTCGRIDAFGSCSFFEEFETCGRYCATGQTCGHVSAFGDCDFYNTVAACGSRTCTTRRTCGYIDSFGNCSFYNESVSCN